MIKPALLLGLIASLALMVPGQSPISSQSVVEPNTSDGWYLLGMSKIQRTTDVSVKVAFEKAIELRPDFAEAHYAIAAWYMSKRRCLLGGNLTKKLEESRNTRRTVVTLLRKAVQLKNEYPAAYVLLGRAYQELDELTEASAAREKAIEQGAKSRWLNIELARIYQKTGRIDEAIQLYRYVTADSVFLQPSSIPGYEIDSLERIWIEIAFAELAGLLNESGSHCDARETYEQMIRLGIANVSTHYKLGLLYLRTGHTDLALREYEVMSRIAAETEHKFARTEIKENAKELRNRIKQVQRD